MASDHVEEFRQRNLNIMMLPVIAKEIEIVRRHLVMRAVLMAAYKHGISPVLEQTFAYWGVWKRRDGTWEEHLQPFAFLWIREEYGILVSEIRHGR